MTDREKLAKLVNESFHKCLSVVCRDCHEYDKDRKAADRSCQGRLFADHLLANGVTVQKHGRWIVGIVKPGCCTPGGNDPWICSECGKIESWMLNKPKTKYCPNCGARMDLEG